MSQKPIRNPGNENTVIGIKVLLNRVISRLDLVKERIRKLKNDIENTTQDSIQRDKKVKNMNKALRDTEPLKDLYIFFIYIKQMSQGERMVKKQYLKLGFFKKAAISCLQKSHIK